MCDIYNNIRTSNYDYVYGDYLTNNNAVIRNIPEIDTHNIIIVSHNSKYTAIKTIYIIPEDISLHKTVIRFNGSILYNNPNIQAFDSVIKNIYHDDFVTNILDFMQSNAKLVLIRNVLNFKEVMILYQSNLNALCQDLITHIEKYMYDDENSHSYLFKISDSELQEDIYIYVPNTNHINIDAFIDLYNSSTIDPIINIYEISIFE